MVLIAFLLVKKTIPFHLGKGEEARSMCCERYYFGKLVRPKKKCTLTGIPAKQQK